MAAFPVPDVSELSLSRLISLEGRSAVVTGGAKGIGVACALRLAEAGANVLIGDVDEAAARAAADEVTSRTGTKVLGCEVDVADERAVVELADRAMTDLGGLDIWVNNAGIFPPGPLLDLTAEGWDLVLDVNLRGAFLGSREAARRMVEQGRGGVIVNITSTAGFKGSGGLPAYVASKHGLGGLTKALAAELGPHGIRALAVAPTLILTPGIDHLREEAGPPMDGFLDELVARLPVGRADVPDDVARVVLFCASDLSVLMTGSTLAVDGGDLAI
jgi:NAD(P)-dependent dehydrogenase (short-subunit alcohol dehydrogenase family)